MEKGKIKAELYRLCLEFVENRFQTIQKIIKEIQVSLTSETKSSAGDKHETGRAMLQLEREKAGNQLAEVQKVKEVLSKIDILKISKNIGLGTLVYTTQANYFISISAGVLKVEDNNFFAISPNTPIAKLLIGKKVGDQIQFRNLNFKVIDLI
jgi:transcription elongation GreA/GreB family factor